MTTPAMIPQMVSCASKMSLDWIMMETKPACECKKAGTPQGSKILAWLYARPSCMPLLTSSHTALMKMVTEIEHECISISGYSLTYN